ncbi:hypothetical protein WJX74_002623 [Apatococcus lobatus]|uniref:HORMA domain-containing protein n=1 Tax=Apatococcus lobatus TaxID=904363 RepID=A0AAW1S661_9CHLO
MSFHGSLAQATRNTITLRGSAQLVTEFFGYAVSSILYQRGIYPPESFEQHKKYGLSVMISADHGLVQYMNGVLPQMAEWLQQGELQRLVLVITSQSTKQVLERWTFNIQTEQDALAGKRIEEKPEAAVSAEIQAIIRQITASVTFLPLLSDPCTFDLLVYTTKDSSVPKEWEDSDPRFITKAADVKLRSFTTKVHKVDALVSYRADEED